MTATQPQRADAEESRGSSRLAARLLEGVRAAPLRLRLFLIVFVGLLPLVLLSSGLLIYDARQQKQRLLGAAEDTMRAVITAVDYESHESLAALQALAASPRLARGDMVGLRAEALQLMARRPEWATVMLSDFSGRQLMNAVTAPTPPLLQPDSLEAAVGSQQATIGDMLFSPQLGMYGFALRVPLLNEGRVRYLLTAVIRPDSVQELLMSQAIPDGGVVAIFDRNRRVVARSRGIDDWLAKPASPGMQRLLEANVDTAWGMTRTLEGIPVYSVFYRSERTGWSAAVGIPVNDLDAPIWRSYLGFGGLVALAAVLGLLASSVVSRSITRPMRELEASAHRIRLGELPAMPKTGLPAIHNALAALVEAHRERERLLQSEQQARLLEQEARRIAEAASREKDEVLAMLSHEFRNPLAAIAASAELLAHEPAPSPAIGQASDIIRRQVKHLAALTSEVLEASRAISGTIHIERRPIDLAGVATRAVEGLRQAGQLERHDVVVDAQPAWVEGDPARLEQVVSNLLTNALKYTPAGGSIEIEVEQSGSEVRLRVRDDGLGIEPELLPRIFQPFVQGSRTLDRSQGGLGIGLSLVQRLVRLHEGTVQARSGGPGHGSEFVVRLPALPEGDRAPTDETHAAPGTRAASVVVVEDNEDVRVSLRRLLELGGHRVREASDGRAGLALICAERPELAILDIGLPGLDGYGVARAVRQRLGDQVRLIALTGYGTDQDASRGAAAGFDDYLIKPVDPATLAGLIQRWRPLSSVDGRADG